MFDLKRKHSTKKNESNNPIQTNFDGTINHVLSSKNRNHDRLTNTSYNNLDAKPRNSNNNNDK